MARERKEGLEALEEGVFSVSGSQGARGGMSGEGEVWGYCETWRRSREKTFFHLEFVTLAIPGTPRFQKRIVWSDDTVTKVPSGSSGDPASLRGEGGRDEDAGEEGFRGRGWMSQMGPE